MTDPAAPGPPPRAPLHVCDGTDRDKMLMEVGIDLGTTSCTVTLFNPFEYQPRPLGPAQSAQLDLVLADVLARADWPPPDPGDPPLAEAVAAAVAGRLPATRRGRLSERATVDDLVAQLRADARDELRQAGGRRPDEDAVVRADRDARQVATIRAFEAAGETHDIDDWLPGRLHEVHGAARALSLTSFRLTQVLFDDDQPEIASVLSIPDDGGVAKATLQAWQERGTVAVRGLKRKLARAEPVREQLGPLPVGWAADSDLLLATAYADLVRRVGRFVDGGPAGPLAGHRMVQLTATYPTITPPVARRRLRSLLEDALERVLRNGQHTPMRVDVSLDEGVAAALFFVMRELGSDNEGTGVERLRASSRVVGERSWQRSLLVVDIGGGTTDIALIGVDLDDVTGDDVTGDHSTGDDGTGDDAGGGVAELFRGRDYLLRPRVLGTSGHAQLGGDLLTLRVLYWIKARIVDALLERSEPSGCPIRDRLAACWAAQVGEDAEVPGALAPLVVGFRDPGPAPVAVRETLRALLPTHSSGAPTPAGPAPAAGSAAGGPARPSNDFLLLWDEAERAKRDLGGGLRYKIRTKTLVDSGLPELTTLSSAAPIELDPAEFTELARPVLDAAMGLAGELARRHLGGTDHRRLDVVALAGRTCGMPLAATAARDTIGATLRDGAAGPAAVIWDPGALEVEEVYAKHAASIGATWAAYHRSNRPDVAAGRAHDPYRTRVHVSVQSLLLDLPCGFSIGDATERGTVIFQPGRRLDRSLPDGTLYVESGSCPLQSQVRLERHRDGGSIIQWGHFDYVDQRHQEQLESAPGPAGPVVDTRLPAGVSFRVRLDQQLEPTLLLRAGAVDHVRVVPVQAPRQVRVSGLPVRPGPLPLIGVQQLDPVPGQPEVVAMFGPGTGRTGYDVLAHVTAAAPQWAAVAARPLPCSRDGDEPAPRAGGRYRLRAGEDWSVDLGCFSVGPAPDGGYWLVLDEHGYFWVTAGYPPYLPARSLSEMERFPGTVFATAMPDPVPDREQWWEPFNGWH